uniref:Uncharacterized protein n=1 Tax=Trypanosoma congolense (strain IL3000) TaxID=1068625 RepID=G0V1D6_TRYCI|nr:hypothetical protein, unlikely [Trypanosoma congolense IL3000]
MGDIAGIGRSLTLRFLTSVTKMKVVHTFSGVRGYGPRVLALKCGVLQFSLRNGKWALSPQPKMQIIRTHPRRLHGCRNRILEIGAQRWPFFFLQSRIDLTPPSQQTTAHSSAALLATTVG